MPKFRESLITTMTFAKTHDEIFLDENNVIRAPKWEEKQFPGGIGVEFFNSMKKHHRNIGQVSGSTMCCTNCSQD